MMFGKSSYKFAVITAAAGLALAGCATTALQPGKSVLEVNAEKANQPLAHLQQPAPAGPAHPTGFDWAPLTLSAQGTGSAPEGMSGPTREVNAQNSATVDAMKNLKDQVRALPVGSDQTVGSIMSTYMTIRHGVEQEIQSAQTVSAQPLADGRYQVLLNLPMERIANMLQQYQITPDQELPDPGPVQAQVSNFI